MEEFSVKRLLCVALLTFAALPNFSLLAAGPTPPGSTRAVPSRALDMMPVREVTVFKDGSAFLRHEGAMPVDASGNLLMDYLPIPTLGTFWPYVKDEVRLKAVSASPRRVQIERTAINLSEVLEGNVGEKALLTETNGTTTTAVILAVPRRSSEELMATSAPNSPERLPEFGDLIQIKTDKGVKTMPISQIRDVTFENAPKPALGREEFRNLLTLQLDWQGKKPTSKVNAGLAYLQKGLRWIPNYRIVLDDKGGAKVQLQATLVNEVLDLQDVTMNLVVGAPNFVFSDKVDPISLQNTLVRLNSDVNGINNSNMAGNAIMSQAARANGDEDDASHQRGVMDLGPTIDANGPNEDLFLFPLKNITLKKGERMTLLVAEYALKYEDVYTLDASCLPPKEIHANMNGDHQREREMEKLLAAPKVKHGIRIKNESQQPFTTAPALLMRGERVLSQVMMTYTPVDGSVDLDMNTALNIQVSKEENEAPRDEKSVKLDGDEYQKINLAGKITLVNRMQKPITVEVKRIILGEVDKGSLDAKITKLNFLEEKTALSQWWEWYDWPAWWNHLNGMSRITWRASLKPGKAVDLDYTWHYYWR
ncbi:TPA: hypothetical protein DDW35_04695 [Candidatus Sumerlaeota bacterium]|nr:hypothetical protein [Candidatus Sumerlaeota bacterium]